MDDNTLSENEVLSLIIGQLIAYGYSAVAQTVADATGAAADMVPSSRLSELLHQAKYRGEFLQIREYMETDPILPVDHDESDDAESANKDFDRDSMQEDVDMTRSGFDMEAGMTAPPKPTPEYTQLYYTQHKGPCRTAIFSADGRFAATGSHDWSLKLLDVNKMKNRTGESGDKPVIRTLYDHTAPVNDLSFHPNGLVLASCSDDQSIKLFDLSKLGRVRSLSCSKLIHLPKDTQPVNSICFHPSGDYILAGTQDPAIRVYDVKTLLCYTNSNTTEMHRGPITQIRYSHTGRLFASASADGNVRIWDSVSSRCVKLLEKVHSGAAVSSVRMTRDEKYILTSGLDSVVRLWDISSGKQVMEYVGHEQRTQLLQPTFSYNEDYVLIGDEASTDVICWDTQTGVLLKKISGQNNLVRCVAASPVDNGILTCSDDYRARYFDTRAMEA
ncbi:cleavage stimulation factor, 3' pre-RNA, subunit 1 [Apophysomyces ossiformis]|uniref:Cleavage stimulation factor 50 kDa subunit n=1 Tax=Apophysomyces ossiformis TaxID=679940 RepID=A0A8H7EPE0_9FUNG|nr:cleavage stimulation factor, 3' pre-RNA, subunit 1 [Apophysomyces ossiformis]